jgi:uncharacterized protein YdcH (DUF465 family)
MSDLNHSLYHDFPDFRPQIEQLKHCNEEFAQMATAYHSLDHKVRGLEMCNVPVTDQTFAELKMQRLQLKDELYRRLQAF